MRHANPPCELLLTCFAVTSHTDHGKALHVCNTTRVSASAHSFPIFLPGLDKTDLMWCRKQTLVQGLPLQELIAPAVLGLELHSQNILILATSRPFCDSAGDHLQI